MEEQQSQSHTEEKPGKHCLTKLKSFSWFYSHPLLHKEPGKKIHVPNAITETEKKVILSPVTLERSKLRLCACHEDHKNATCYTKWNNAICIKFISFCTYEAPWNWNSVLDKIEKKMGGE